MHRFPVFIVGSPRSGTSVITSAMMHAGYRGYNEGNFLSLLHRLEKLVDGHFQAFPRDNPRALTAAIEPEEVKRGLYAVLFDTVTKLYAGEPWLDKSGTEEMLLSIPILLELWPQARFIFAKRRAIENIYSRVKKFPNLPFEQHCISWTRIMATWGKMREQIPNLPAIEIDQREIVETPAVVAARMAEFLDLPETAREKIEEIFTRRRPQETEAGSADRVLGLRMVGWSEQEQETFRQRCGEQMRKYNYSLDSNYWRQLPHPVASAGSDA